MLMFLCIRPITDGAREIRCGWSLGSLISDENYQSTTLPDCPQHGQPMERVFPSIRPLGPLDPGPQKQ